VVLEDRPLLDESFRCSQARSSTGYVPLMVTNEEIMQVVRGKFSDGGPFQPSAVASDAGTSVADVTAVLDAAVVAEELTVAVESIDGERVRVFRYAQR
jgi:hypothetical protein